MGRGVGCRAALCPQNPQRPPTCSLLPPCSGCRSGDIAGNMRLLRALLCLCLLAQVAPVALASWVRTRRELAPGLYEHGVYDARGSYCQRGDVCCHGRDDGCTVPYQDTLCYCDLFCNRTVSDCCPDFWEYCLGIPAPFPNAPGEAAPSPAGQGSVGAYVLCDALRVMDTAGHGTPWLCPRCRTALDPSELGKRMQSGHSGAELPEMGLGAACSPPACPCTPPWAGGQRGSSSGGDTWGRAGVDGSPSRFTRSCLGQADAGPDLTRMAAGAAGGEQGARAAPLHSTRLSKKFLQSRASSQAQLAPLSPSRQARRARPALLGSPTHSPTINPLGTEPTRLPLCTGGTSWSPLCPGWVGTEVWRCCLALRTALIFFPLGIFPWSHRGAGGTPDAAGCSPGLSPFSHPGCARAGRTYPTGATYRENCNLW